MSVLKIDNIPWKESDFCEFWEFTVRGRKQELYALFRYSGPSKFPYACHLQSDGKMEISFLVKMREMERRIRNIERDGGEPDISIRVLRQARKQHDFGHDP